MRLRVAGASLLLAGALAATAGALWAYGTLAHEVAEGETQAVDDRFLAWLHQFAAPALDALARFVSLLGSEVVTLLLVGLLAASVWRRRWGTTLALLVVAAGAHLLNDVLKAQFQRPRPTPVLSLIPAQAWSFPSGHAMVAAAFYLYLAYLAWQRLRGRARRLVPAALVALVLLIGLSRLYLGVHYLSDVVAGFAAGAAWAAAVVLAGALAAGQGDDAVGHRRHR